MRLCSSKKISRNGQAPCAACVSKSLRCSVSALGGSAAVLRAGTTNWESQTDSQNSREKAFLLHEREQEVFSARFKLPGPATPESGCCRSNRMTESDESTASESYNPLILNSLFGFDLFSVDFWHMENQATHSPHHIDPDAMQSTHDTVIYGVRSQLDRLSVLPECMQTWAARFLASFWTGKKSSFT
ncbi:hypothetical protein DOTSEDRAFT_34399 [Dothistroma septosporum NZE10]|uniref:Uncharacterized protein n=1 Tax=Dothistroma septosporum (strain NZE10 / CBS 128990) TaxID=675120 RepID=N1PN30_DOTSN|nr:hypothetical protein DOTSEDRAFT_34399 [Dothistroma septosporum NZE10]